MTSDMPSPWVETHFTNQDSEDLADKMIPALVQADPAIAEIGPGLRDVLVGTLYAGASAEAALRHDGREGLECVVDHLIGCLSGNVPDGLR